MSLDVGELERLWAAADPTIQKYNGPMREGAEERRDAYLAYHATEIVRRLKAAEEMRSAIRDVESAGIPSRHGPNVRLMELPPLIRLLSSAGAYDAASRPVSATSGVVETGEVDNGATS